MAHEGNENKYSLGALNASISYINRSIDQMNANIQTLDIKIDNLSSQLTKDIQAVTVEMTRTSVETGTKLKGMIGVISFIVSIITTLVMSGIVQPYIRRFIETR